MLYAQDFIDWAKLKIRIHLSTPQSPVYFKESEVWWVSLGLNIGYEQNGKNSNFERPVLVLKKYNKDIFLALPLTSRQEDAYYRQKFMYESDGIEKEGVVILDQIRTVSSKRLLRKMGTVPTDEILSIRERIINDFI